MTRFQEPLSRSLAFSMTPSERLMLEELADEHGATLSGYLRLLIRRAGRARQGRQSGTSGTVSTRLNTMNREATGK